jgi:outer membrane protein TolC
MSRAALILLLSGLAHAEDAPLTLEAAIDLALHHNERAGKASQRVEVAAGGLDRARAAFLPTLVGQGNGAWAKPADRDGRNLSGDVQFTLNQPIVNASAFPLYWQSKHNLAAERWGAVEDLRTLSFDTANAFLTALASEQLLAAARGRLDRAQADRADTETRVAGGLNSTNDLTRATLAVATAQSQVDNAQGSLERAYLQLAFLVGQPVKGPLVAPERTTNNARKNVWKPEEVEKRAEARRPDLLSAEEHTLSLYDGAKEPLYRLLPTLGFSAQLRQLIDPGPSQNNPTSGNLSLTMTWVVYDAGIRYADRRTRLAQAASAALDEHTLRRSIATDIAVALAQLHAARAVLKTQEEAVKTAQSNTDETEILYKQGIARAIELTDANATRYDAETALALAKLSMEEAYLELRFALGLGVVTDELPAPSPVRKRGAF